MIKPQLYSIKIDHLRPEKIEADSPSDASRQVSVLIESHESLRRLRDDEPVEIKRPDGRPWGRNLSLGAFRNGPVLPSDNDDTDDGQIRPSSIVT